jgi:hypothetical protein
VAAKRGPDILLFVSNRRVPTHVEKVRALAECDGRCCCRPARRRRLAAFAHALQWLCRPVAELRSELNAAAGFTSRHLAHSTAL